MFSKTLKSLLAAVFSLFFLFIFSNGFSQEDSSHKEQKKGFNAKEIIFGHVLNNHDFHLLDLVKDNGEKHPVSIPLPVILYSKQRGLAVFMSSKFHHGEENYRNYMMLTEEKIEELHLDPTTYNAQDILAVTEGGEIDNAVRVYDISLTRNVVQMILALALFTWVMLSIAKKYKSGQGVTTAPKGAQGLLEPVIIFVRDEVARPNLGKKEAKYLPFLLTIFFFILINNLFGLIPGSANVTGNIAFTAVLGIISFIVILVSTNSHYWMHILNPPGVPLGVKFILVPVEILSVFIKPFALIIRLFANMVAGHIIIICLISLIFIFGNMSSVAGWGTAPFSLAFTIFIYFIEVLVAFIQAFIFTMLTAVFIGQALEGEHDHEHHEHENGLPDIPVMV
ncbi:MAG TPA: F0F1 ATP synthase subunit A [Chitinophagaceae bacterium]|nr:F0F1 ATP synthase subunit A [Chitinophagaceae bacterium]